MNFETLRQKNGLTQTELSKKLNVKQQLISRWENGLGKPSLKLITKIARTLGVSVEEILECFE